VSATGADGRGFVVHGRRIWLAVQEILVTEVRNHTIARVARVYGRMLRSQAGGSHEPAIRATRAEAPAISHAYTLEARDLEGTLPALSPHERNAIVLVLYHPGTLELVMQGALSPLPLAHPLHDHPLAAALPPLPPLKGTLDVAARLGVLQHHPRQCIADDACEGGMDVAVPLIGDLLIYLLDSRGPYCVNWNVKQHNGDHARPGPGNVRKRYRKHSLERAAARLDVEIGYYEDAGIRTQLVAGEQMDKYALATLLRLFRWNLRPVSLRPAARKMLENQFRVGMRDGIPPIETMALARKHYGYSLEDCQRVLNQAIWRREIKVDLFGPVLVDRPLRPERRDVLVEYADWFRR
jgi:hypothetical protein